MFNYIKLSQAEARAHAAEVLQKSLSGLYDKMLADKDAQIERLQTEIGIMKGKISLMETIIMPLSSRAGADYQEALHPRPPQKIMHTTPTTSEWQRYKQKKDAELEASYLEDGQKESTNAKSLS